MYEIPTLAIVNEVFFRMNYDYAEIFKSFQARMDEKLMHLKEDTFRLGTFSEFGLRRELSEEGQDYTIGQFVKYRDELLKKGTNFVGLRDAGDPVERAAAYDIEGADELVFLDITASFEERKAMLDVIRKTAGQVFMPL